MSGLDKTEAADLKQTTVEEGTRFKGTLESTCRVVVRGAVDGELNAPNVVISETGAVTGSVKAQSLQSSGVLAGRVDVDDLVLGGSVRGDTVIRAKTLEVKLQQPEEGGKIEMKFGECVLEVGDDPALELGEPSGSRQAANQSGKKSQNGRKQEPAEAAAKAATSGADAAASGETRAASS